MNGRTRLVAIGMHLILTVWTIFVVAPIGLMLISAFKSQAEIFTKPLSLPGSLNLSAFQRAWNIGIGSFMLNSLLVTVLSVTVIITTSGLAAYVLARSEAKVMKWLYILIIASFAIPVQSVLVPLYQMVSGGHMLNSQLGIVLPYAAFGIPFTTVLFYAFFLEFPRELEEAARLDGCSRLQIFFRIVVPLSGPVVASAAIFQAVFNWNEFLLALMMLTEKSVRTLPVGIYGLTTQYSSDWPAIMAALTIATLPLLILFILAQRHFVRSLAGLGK